MATVHITKLNLDSTFENSTDPLPVPRSVPDADETITSSASSQQTTITADKNDIWEVVSNGGAVWIKSGTNPTAAVGDDMLLLSGERLQYVASVDSEKLAVIDA